MPTKNYLLPYACGLFAFVGLPQSLHASKKRSDAQKEIQLAMQQSGRIQRKFKECQSQLGQLQQDFNEKEHDKPKQRKKSISFIPGQDIMPNKVAKLKKLVNTNELKKSLTKLYKEAIGAKPTVFFIGTSGAGKSTLIAYLLGCAMAKYDNCRIKIAATPEGLEKIPQIGDSIEPETVGAIHYNHPRLKLGFCDTEGFLLKPKDVTPEQVFTSALAPYFSFKISPIKGFVLTITLGDLLSIRGNIFNDVVKLCTTYFGQIPFQALKPSFSLAITQTVTLTEEQVCTFLRKTIQTCYRAVYKALDQKKGKNSQTNNTTDSDEESEDTTSKAEQVAALVRLCKCLPEGKLLDRKNFLNLFLTQPVPREKQDDLRNYVLDKTRIFFIKNSLKSNERKSLLKKLQSLEPLALQLLPTFDTPYYRYMRDCVAQQFLQPIQRLIHEIQDSSYQLDILPQTNVTTMPQSLKKLQSDIKALNKEIDTLQQSQKLMPIFNPSPYRANNPYHAFLLELSKEKKYERLFRPLVQIVASVAIGGVCLAATLAGYPRAATGVGIIGGGALSTEEAYTRAQRPQKELKKAKKMIEYRKGGYLSKTFCYNGATPIAQIVCKFTNGNIEDVAPAEEVWEVNFDFNFKPKKEKKQSYWSWLFSDSKEEKPTYHTLTITSKKDKYRATQGKAHTLMYTTALGQHADAHMTYYTYEKDHPDTLETIKAKKIELEKMKALAANRVKKKHNFKQERKIATAQLKKAKAALAKHVHILPLLKAYYKVLHTPDSSAMQQLQKLIKDYYKILPPPTQGKSIQKKKKERD